MQEYQKAFIDLAISKGALKFGRFKLKSGRTSPYFFNSGVFNDSASVAALGQYYAQTLANAQISFDLLFGPAYKGIPLATATAVACYEVHNKNCSLTYNRKEAKDHGEGGLLVGAPLTGKVVIVDDVITAGTAIRQAIDLINTYKEAELTGIIIALDRQEKGLGNLSAVQEITQQYSIPVLNIANLDTLLEYLHHQPNMAEHLDAIQVYRRKYGV